MTSVPDSQSPSEKRPQRSPGDVSATITPRVLWVTAILVLILILIFAVYLFLPRGVIVIVNNVGKVPLQEVWVHVTGMSYSFGNIAPGKSRSIRVNPTSESHVEVSFRTPNERPRSMVAGCYFEHNYSGTVTVEVDGASKEPVSVRSDVSVGPW